MKTTFEFNIVKNYLKDDYIGDKKILVYELEFTEEQLNLLSTNDDLDSMEFYIKPIKKKTKLIKKERWINE